nr:hypothetical protein [Nocardia amamiensis]
MTAALLFAMEGLGVALVPNNVLPGGWTQHTRRIGPGVYREIVACSRSAPTQLAQRYRDLLVSLELPLTAATDLPADALRCQRPRFVRARSVGGKRAGALGSRVGEDETASDLEVELGADHVEWSREAIGGQVDPRFRRGGDFGAVRFEFDVDLHFGGGAANGQLACYRESLWAATDGVAMERDQWVVSHV